MLPAVAAPLLALCVPQPSENFAVRAFLYRHSSHAALGFVETGTFRPDAHTWASPVLSGEWAHREQHGATQGGAKAADSLAQPSSAQQSVSRQSVSDYSDGSHSVSGWQNVTIEAGDALLIPAWWIHALEAEVSTQGLANPQGLATSSMLLLSPCGRRSLRPPLPAVAAPCLPYALRSD